MRIIIAVRKVRIRKEMDGTWSILKLDFRRYIVTMAAKHNKRE
jgi:hypothetical protein